MELFDMDENGLLTVVKCRAALDRLDREFSDSFIRKYVDMGLHQQSV